jgi:hypothetical protein
MRCSRVFERQCIDRKRFCPFQIGCNARDGAIAGTPGRMAHRNAPLQVPCLAMHFLAGARFRLSLGRGLRELKKTRIFPPSGQPAPGDTPPGAGNLKPPNDVALSVCGFRISVAGVNLLKFRTRVRHVPAIRRPIPCVPCNSRGNRRVDRRAAQTVRLLAVRIPNI